MSHDKQDARYLVKGVTKHKVLETPTNAVTFVIAKDQVLFNNSFQEKRRVLITQ